MRQASFDVLRLLAAVCVIFIHIGFNQSSLPDADLYLNTVLRWCVPVFFVMSGYFLRGEDLSEAISWSRVARVLKIAVVANLFYLPFSLVFTEGRTLYEIAIAGTWTHLWFINALVFALVVLKMYDRHIHHRGLLLVGSVLILLGLHALDAMVAIQDAEVPRSLWLLRFLQAIPMVWAGFALHQRQVAVSLRQAWTLVLSGTVLCLAEAAWLMQIGTQTVTPQFPLGTLPMTFGLFWVFQNASFARFDRLARLGREASLLIYLLHPFVLSVLKFAALSLGLSPDVLLGLQLSLGVIVSVLLPVLLIRHAPGLAGVFTGTWRLPRSLVDQARPD